MVNLKNITHIYLLGIGGIGMSALARYFRVTGKVVAGYDKTETTLTRELQNEGIQVHFEDNTGLLPPFLSGHGVNPNAIVIYTPAIPRDHQEFKHLVTCGYKMWKRSEILGLITRNSRTIAVAGTHGKTTTSTMIAHILKANAVNCTAFLGGISKNYQSNLLLPEPGTESDVVVAEADEYDRSFLTLFPDIAVITSLDSDHLDIYGNREAMVESYSLFAAQVKSGGTLISKWGLRFHGTIKPDISYSIGKPSTYEAINVRIENSNYVFDLKTDQDVHTHITLTWPGRHNVENATGAIAACRVFGISMEGIRSALESFSGVNRRFDYQLRTPHITYIDDYAHHPEELRATINSVKELYPGKRILGVFQPHLYTRTRDFAEGFGSSLSLLDELILMDIYPAREQPIPGITSQLIEGMVSISDKRICKRPEVIPAVLESNASVVLTLGAGDIDELVPAIKESLQNKYSNLTA